MNIDDFNNTITNLIINSKDGLYNYYKKRIQNKEILNIDDKTVIDYFLKNVDKNSKILEIAAGIGQVSHYLNINGYTNVTINECDAKRFNLAVLINKSLNNKCQIVNNKYQELQLSKYDYIFTINAVSSHVGIESDFPIIKKALDNGSKVILKEKFFGIKNDTFFTDLLKKHYKHTILFVTDTPYLLFYL